MFISTLEVKRLNIKINGAFLWVGGIRSCLNFSLSFSPLAFYAVNIYYLFIKSIKYFKA